MHIFLFHFLSLTYTHSYRRVYLSVAAAAIYMASQASEIKKTQKGLSSLPFQPSMHTLEANTCTISTCTCTTCTCTTSTCTCTMKR